MNKFNMGNVEMYCDGYSTFWEFKIFSNNRF